MWLLDKLKRRSEDTTQEETTPADEALLQALLKGETITKNKAMSIPAVSSAVDKISSIVAMLPIYLYKETINGDGKKQIEQIENDERVKLLNSETGDTLDAFQFKKALVQDYLLDKGGFAFIRKKGTKFVGLHYVDSAQVTYIKNEDPIYKDGQYLVNGKYYELFQFIALLRETKDGITGKGLIDEVSKAIETAFTNMLFELNLTQKGGVKKGFIKSEKKLGQDELDKLKKAWKKLYSTNEENVMVLNNGINFQDAGSTSVELQLNERKKSLKEEINDIFHIGTDYNTTVKEAIMPILIAFQTVLNAKMLLESEKDTFYFSFDIRELTKGNQKERYESYKTAKETGWMTNNEIRYLEDLEQIEGLDTISFSLANVIYDIKTHQYYVPNTGATFNTLEEAIKFNKGGESKNEDTN